MKQQLLTQQPTTTDDKTFNTTVDLFDHQKITQHKELLFNVVPQLFSSGLYSELRILCYDLINEYCDALQHNINNHRMTQHNKIIKELSTTKDNNYIAQLKKLKRNNRQNIKAPTTNKAQLKKSIIFMLYEYTKQHKELLRQHNTTKKELIKMVYLKNGVLRTCNHKPYSIRDDQKRIKKSIVDLTTSYRNTIKKLLVIIGDNSKTTTPKNNPKLKVLSGGVIDDKNKTVLLTHTQYLRILNKHKETMKRVNRLRNKRQPIKGLETTENIKVLLRTIKRPFNGHNNNSAPTYNLKYVKMLYDCVYKKHISTTKIKEVLVSMGYEKNTIAGYKRTIYAGHINHLINYNGYCVQNKKSRRIIAEAIKIKDNKPYFSFAIKRTITEAPQQPPKDFIRWCNKVYSPIAAYYNRIAQYRHVLSILPTVPRT